MSTTVLITHYNQHDYLCRALQSLREQRRPADEVLVIDDGSPTPGVEAVCAEFPETRLITQKNTGVVGARTTGLNAARGDYVLHLDADDWLKPNALADLGAALEVAPDAAFVFGRSEKRWADDPARAELSPEPVPEENLYHRMLTTNPVRHPGQVLVRRSHALGAGGWRSFNPVEDYEFLIRLAAQHPVVFCPAVVSVYFQHSSNSSANPARMFRALCKAYVAHAEIVPDDVPSRQAFTFGRGNHLDFYGRGVLLDFISRRGNRSYPRPGLTMALHVLKERPGLSLWLLKLALGGKKPDPSAN